MHIQFSPQRSDAPLSYKIDGDVITVTLDGQAETLDFSGTEDGVWEADANGQIDTLAVVLAARREAGVLYLTLRSHHGPQPADAERFPAPVEVTGPTTFTFPEER